MAADSTRPRGLEPRKGPTAEQWSDLKDTILTLYRDKGHSLPYVQQYMQRHHDFRASPKMYKDRFRRWGVRKNMPRYNSISPTEPVGDDDADHHHLPTRQLPHHHSHPSHHHYNHNHNHNHNHHLQLQQRHRQRQHHHHHHHHPPDPSWDPRNRIVFFQGSMDGPKAYQAALNAVFEYSAYAFAPSASQSPSSAALPPLPYLYPPGTAARATQLATGARLIRRGEVARGFALVDATFHDFAVGRDRDGVENIYTIGYGALALLGVSEALFASWLRFVARVLAARKRTGGYYRTTTGGGSDGGDYVGVSPVAAPMERYAEAMLALGNKAQVRRAAETLIPMICEIKMRMLGERLGGEEQRALVRMHESTATMLLGEEGVGDWDGWHGGEEQDRAVVVERGASEGVDRGRDVVAGAGQHQDTGWLEIPSLPITGPDERVVQTGSADATMGALPILTHDSSRRVEDLDTTSGTR